ncbi:SGNH/GDSL hydrolase family protein [uncultured Jatrophihabitans sp.]|uniref:SGNH/GDSL hydrolase family protein n=1 Tax=uncultured Jatrophihabitans sp. TaxID=1610747 RepID=UPI0035CBFA50
MQRLSSWLVVLLAVAVFAAAGYVITKKDPVPDAGTVLPVPAASAPLSSGAGGSTSSAAGKVVAFLGDDWTSGVGASTKAKRFTSLLAGQLDFVEKNFGRDGSGYAKSGGADGAYDSRVDDVAAAKPDVVIVSGGRNDTADYLPTLRARIKALFADLHDRLPNATLIALAPMWGDSEPPADLEPVAAAVKQYVQAAGGTYLDLTDPVRGHPEFMDDDADPNNKGYAAIATALAPKIRSLLG